tara:strand:- start:1969 stop:2370 length:402 start_codon:yes stop_codon:yes gene_type:complete
MIIRRNRAIAAGAFMCGAISALIGIETALAADDSPPPQTEDQLRRAQACEVIDQVISAPLDEALGRGGFMYQCEAIPDGDTLTVFGRLQVAGTGGPTQAQFLGTVKPAPSGRAEDWTLCTLTINNEDVGLPGC